MELYLATWHMHIVWAILSWRNKCIRWVILNWQAHGDGNTSAMEADMPAADKDREGISCSTQHVEQCIQQEHCEVM